VLLSRLDGVCWTRVPGYATVHGDDTSVQCNAVGVELMV